MAYAYALSPGPERDSALSSIKIRFKECTEALKKIECEFESSIGSIMIEMKGIQGFARICPGDVFEITIKYGDGQKWKSRGKILKNNDQVWDNQSVTFKALIDSVLSIRAVEVRGFGKNITLGNKLCETRSLFSAHPQLMTVNLNNIGTLKLNLVVTWNPLHGVSGSLFKSQSLLSKSSSSLFGSMRSLPALFSGSSLSGKKSSDRSGTLPIHCRIPVSVTRSDLFTETPVNHSNVSCNSSQYGAAAATASSTCQMKKSASAMAGITVKCNSDSTSSGSTSSSLHLMGTTVSSSGFGSGSSYCSGSTSVPSSALTSPDCESAPIILSSVSRQALPINSTSPSASYYFNINSYRPNSTEANSTHHRNHGTFAVANAAAAAAAASSSASHRLSSTGLFNGTQFPAGVVGSGATATAATTSIPSTGGLLSGGTSSFKNNNNNNSITSGNSSNGHGNNCQPTSRMYLSASASNLSRGGSAVSSSASSSSAYGSGSGTGAPTTVDSQRRNVFRPMSQIVKINLDSQQFNSNCNHTSKGEVNNYSACCNGSLASNLTSTSSVCNNSSSNNNSKLFHSSVKSRLFDRSYNEDIIEVADESTDCSSDLTDCSPSKGSMGTNDTNTGQMMMIPSSGEEDYVILSPPGPPKPILPSSCTPGSTASFSHPSVGEVITSNGSSHPALFSSSFTGDDRRLTSATSRSSVYPLASDYINLSDALINLISSLEDIQGQYTQTLALQVNVQNLFKIIKDISAFAANQVKRTNQQRKQQQMLLQQQQQQQQQEQDDEYDSYENQTDSYNHSYSQVMLNNNNYNLPGNTYNCKVNGNNNNNNNGSNSFILSNNCKNSSKNNSPCKSSSATKLFQQTHSSNYLRGNNNHHTSQSQSQQLNRSNLGSRTGSFTSDYSFAVESALQSFDFLNTAASDNDSSFNGCDNNFNRSHNHQHSQHLIDNLSKSIDHLNIASGLSKNKLSHRSRGQRSEKDNRQRLSHGFSLNLQHEQVTSFMTPHSTSVDDESADDDDDDEDVENELNGRHDVINHFNEKTIYTPRRSKSSAEHLTFTTGSRQFDLAILHHISQCQRLLLDVGQFGPLKERENASLTRLADHAIVMGKLCCLCQHIRDYTREINLLQEDNEESDILRLQAAEALYIQRVDQQLAHLFDDSRVTCIWQVVTQQHLRDNIDLFTDSSCPLITVTVSQFISSLKWILNKCLPVNTSNFTLHSDGTLATRSISTGSLSRGSHTNDQLYTQIAHLMTRRVLDNCAYDSDSILTVFQLHLFLKCDNPSSQSNGSSSSSSSPYKSLDHLLQELYNEQTTLLALSSNDAIRVKQCLNRFKKNVPPREPLCHIGLLALQNNDPLIARIAETYFLDARKNKSQRKEVSYNATDAHGDVNAVFLLLPSQLLIYDTSFFILQTSYLSLPTDFHLFFSLSRITFICRS